LRRRNSNHKSVDVAVHAGRPWPDRRRFRRTEQQFRFSKFKIGRSRYRNRHNSPIGPQESQFFAITSPKRHTLSALLGKLPRTCGWRCTRSRRRTEGANIELIFSGLVRHVSSKTIVRGKARPCDLELAVENLDRFPFARPGKRQRKYRSTGEIGRKVSQITP